MWCCVVGWGHVQGSEDGEVESHDQPKKNAMTKLFKGK